MKISFHTLIASSAILLSFAACSNDKGNYDYVSENELMPVEIITMDSVSIKANSLLAITPTVKNDDKSRYKYTWYTIAKAWPYKRDTLSTEHDLSLNCNLNVGEYTLYYQVKDSLKDIYKYVSTPLTVTATDINSGWYVMKEQNGTTDVNYYPMTGTIRTNLLADVMGVSPLIGSPVGMVYGASCYNQEVTNQDGSATMLYGQSIFHLVSTKDMLTLNVSDMSVFKKLSEEFYETPSTINFQAIAIDQFRTQSLINNGQMHDLLSGAGVGKFSYQKSGNFKFFPRIISGQYDNYVYDQNSSSLYDSVMGTEFFQCADFSGSTIFADSSFVMLNFIPRVEGSYKSSAYAVLKGGLKGKYYVAAIGLYSNYLYPAPTFTEIPSSCGLLSADVMAAPKSASVIYFGKDNVLKIFKPSLVTEETLKTFDSGEKIAFIKNISGTNADKTKFNDLVVITNTSTGYKVYRFPLMGSAGEIDVSSSAVMTGTGAASFIMFRQN